MTRLLIPDNCKTATTANTRYETVLNRSYQELAEYYGTAIVPARVRKPQDKSAVEASVRFMVPEQGYKACVSLTTRIDPNPDSGSPVYEAIMGRIIHIAYEVLVEGRISIRERSGLKSSLSKGGEEDVYLSL